MSKATNIIQNIISTIQQINGGPTYTNTIANNATASVSQVEEGARHFTKIPADQFPHFNVMMLQEKRIPEPSYLKSEMLVRIDCTFNGSTETEIGSWLADVEIALAQNIRRGNSGNVHESFVQAINWDNGAFQPIRMVQMEIYVRYSYPFGQP